MKMLAALWTSVVTGVVAAVLVGCGSGGGSGSGDGGTPPPFAATAARYWVSGAGSRWVYQRVDGRATADPSPVLKTVTDMGEQVVGGVPVRRFEHSLSLFEDLPETEYRRFDNTSILQIADLAATFGEHLGIQSYAEVPAPLAEGQSVTVVDRTESIDLNGDGVADTIRIEANANIGRVPTLSVPAGDFTDVLRVRTVLTGTASDGATGMSASAVSTLTAWYAPGVGIVRRVYEDPQYAAPTNTVTEELIGLDAGGRRAGILPDVPLLDDIGAANNVGGPTGVAFAVGGDRTLTLATRAGSLEAALRTLDGTLVWRGTALQAPQGHEFGIPSIAFDGTNFRVIAAHRKPFDSPTQTTLRAQRMAADGTLRDTITGGVLDSGIVDTTQSIGSLHSAARNGRLLLAWGRYDTTYVEVGPGLVRERGYVLEGRLFDEANMPLAQRFTLTEALPAAVAPRGDQFIVIPTPHVDAAMPLRAWGVSAVDGLPVDPAGTVVDARATWRTEPVLQPVGGDLWLSYGSFNGLAPGPAQPTITLARLGANGVLLDGTPTAPGHDLLQADSARSLGRIGLAGAENVLAWKEGWNTLKATHFNGAVLAGSAPLPTVASPLTVGAPPNAAQPSRSLHWAGAAGGGLMVVWMENDQVAGAAEAVRATLILPRLVVP